MCDRKTLNPYLWSHCASYDLQDHAKGLVKVFIKSPVQVYVILHSKDQISIPKELAVYKRFENLGGKRVVEVDVEKTIDLDQKNKPCYSPADNNNVSFGAHSYTVLSQKILEEFNCTTLYIPEEFRKGAKICDNETALALVHQFIMYSSSSLATNLWMSDYYTNPPCLSQMYTIQETIRTEGKLQDQ